MEESFEHRIPLTSIASGMEVTPAPGVEVVTIQIVNVIFIEEHHKDETVWVLVDAGMPKSAETIRLAAEQRFGENARPQAILLTHGHFDHVGAIEDLIALWQVPVYAHEDELPYLTGQFDYPKGNAEAGGGLVSTLSPLFPNHGIDLGHHVDALPSDGTVPFLDDWVWIATPGHTPGHVSFFRPRDSVLLSGDAVVTVKQESLYHVMVQDTQVNGPPAYFTSDWNRSRQSIERIRSLRPSTLIPGHGKPVAGEELKHGLYALLTDKPS